MRVRAHYFLRDGIDQERHEGRAQEVLIEGHGGGALARLRSNLGEGVQRLADED